MIRYAQIRPLRTHRLLLRKLRIDDVPLYYKRIGSRREVTDGMLFEPHESIRDSEASIEKALRRYEAGRCYRWAIALPEDDSIIGVIELLAFDEEKCSCSFAYMLCPEFWGGGYGTEALRAVLEYAFSVLQVDVVEVDHFTTNPASGAVMRKAGMKYQRTICGKYEKQGKRLDADQYRICKEEWNI